MQEQSTWFSSYPPFAYDPTTGLKSNFDRLADQRKWGRKLKHKRWTECQRIMFASLYGHSTEVGKLEKWQDLCREVLISTPPSSIRECRKVLGNRKVLVNLVNLIDHRLIGVPVIRFNNYNEFLTYTRDGRIFPLHEAKEEGFIKSLLRKVRYTG